MSKLHRDPFFTPPTQENPLQLSEDSKMRVKYKALHAVQPRQRDRKADCRDHILRDRLQHVLPNCKLPRAKSPQYIPPRTRPSTTTTVGSKPIHERMLALSPEFFYTILMAEVLQYFRNFHCKTVKSLILLGYTSARSRAPMDLSFDKF